LNHKDLDIISEVDKDILLNEKESWNKNMFRGCFQHFFP
jgi:hypothetical protein